MGGDFAPENNLLGLKQAAQEFDDISAFLLVGKEAEIQKQKEAAAAAEAEAAASAVSTPTRNQ